MKPRTFLMAALLAGSALAPVAWAQTTPALIYSQPLAPQAVRTVQERLRQMRFYAGAVDGVWGADTQAAIEHFQQGRGLQPTGQLNPATISALGLDPNSLGMAGQTVR